MTLGPQPGGSRLSSDPSQFPPSPPAGAPRLECPPFLRPLQPLREEGAAPAQHPSPHPPAPQARTPASLLSPQRTPCIQPAGTHRPCSLSRRVSGSGSLVLPRTLQHFLKCSLPRHWTLGTPPTRGGGAALLDTRFLPCGAAACNSHVLSGVPKSRAGRPRPEQDPHVRSRNPMWTALVRGPRVFTAPECRDQTVTGDRRAS